ncbi:HAD family hydrolase [Oscillibacter sp.]|uniref:D-glycero-alpha-D-manno-heptose-1,7-bisphosphate 7-phosphatase n=1 Tax=Oscillibacter sp. TaxID=1945593 RepID=UPI00289A1BC3|nr:HAD family hydrolase [Oscillibacter sp.]
MNQRKAVFLDRDGTLIVERNYLGDPARVTLLEGVPQALKRLADAGFLLVMVTNQSGVARGYFTMDDVARVNGRVAELLEREGVRLDAVYICPHHEQGSVPEYAVSCTCRKPSPGMALAAAKEWNLDLSASYMIGDKHTDVSFGRNFGARESYLVRTGHGAEAESGYYVVVARLSEAAADILRRDRENP